MAIRKASRQDTHLLISLTGPSGSGKTKSALRLAEGLVGAGGKIGFIDTESGRSGIYADEHSFDVIDIAPPFTPESYIAALREFEDAGYEAVIVDSASHEWEGSGGVLNMADAQKNSRGQPLMGLAKWLKPKKEHKRFVQDILRTRMHVIVCLRAKREYEQTRGADGRDVVVAKGWKENQEKDFIYEMTVSALLSNEPGRQGFPQLTKCPGTLAHAFPANAPVTEDSGAAVAAWLGEIRRDAELEILIRDATDAAQGGEAVLKAHWSSLAPAQQLRLKPSMSSIKAVAAEADATATADNDDAAGGVDLKNPFSAAE